MSNIDISKLNEDQIAELRAKLGIKDRKDDDFIPVWRREGKKYGSSIIEIPEEILESALEHGGKVWINVFPNKYWEKKKKGERPLFNLTFNKYTPRKK